MITPKNSTLRVNIYSQSSKLAQYLKQEFETVGAEVAVNKKFNKKHFTGKNVTSFPHYMVLVGGGGDLGKIAKFAEVTGVKFVWILSLINDTQKDYQKLLSLVANLPKDVFCKVVWLGGDVNSFGGNFELKGDYYLIAQQDAASCIRRTMFSFWSKRVEEVTITDKIPQADLVGKFSPNKKIVFYQGQLRGRLVTPKTDTIARLKVITPPKKTASPVKSHKLLPKKVLALGLLLIFILSFPFLLLAGAQGLYWAGTKTFEDNPKNAEKLFSRSYELSNLSFALFPFVSTKKLSQSASVGKHAALSIDALKQIYTTAAGQNKGDIIALSDKLSVNLDRVYTLTGFLGNGSSSGLLWGARFAKKLDVLIGESAPKTYAFVIQDTSHAMPAGGKIVALALITFQKGEIVNTEIVSPEEIDRQMKGFVPAPAALSQLKTERWLFSFANWDPDFTSAAQKIEWFLETALDAKVDGVVALTQNMSTQGNRKTYLEGKIEDLKKEAQKSPLAFSLGLLSLVKSKDLQIYVDDTSTQQLIDELTQKQTLKALKAGVFEANLGGDEANPLEKSLQWEIDLDGRLARSQVRVGLVNNYESPYRGYFRLIVPQGVTLGKIDEIEAGKVTKTTNPEIVGREGGLEAGIYVEISPNSQKEIVFHYIAPIEIDLEQPGTLDFYWQKQAGSTGGPFLLQVDLTKGRQYRYNTNSEEDFYQKINW